MSRRIEPRPSRVGEGDGGSDPDHIRDLEERVERHERVTRGKPRVSFRAVLTHKRKRDEAPSETPEDEGPVDAWLGYSPGQAAQLGPTRSERRSGKVIFKG